MTEDDVRRIVREEIARTQLAPEQLQALFRETGRQLVDELARPTGQGPRPPRNPPAGGAS